MASTTTLTSVNPDEAVGQRITLYCRALGFDYPPVIQEIIDVAVGRTRRSGCEPDDSQFVRFAMSEVLKHMHECFNRLPPAGETLSPDARCLLPWRLRAVFHRHPEAVYRGDSLPEEVQSFVGRAHHPVLPRENRLDMPAQELGPQPELFSKSFWRQTGDGLLRVADATLRGLSNLGRRGI